MSHEPGAETISPKFLSKEMWPPSSPDLNPMDFFVWSILEARACSKVTCSVDDKKASLLRGWEEIANEILRICSGQILGCNRQK